MWQVLSQSSNYSSFYSRKCRRKKHTTIGDFRKLPLNATEFETLNSLKSWGAFLSGYRDLILKGLHKQIVASFLLFNLPPSFCASLFLLNPTELSAQLSARASRIRCSIPGGTRYVLLLHRAGVLRHFRWPATKQNVTFSVFHRYFFYLNKRHEIGKNGYQRG